MEHLRKLIKRCTVGKYSFDVAINRQIVLEGFKKFPSLWKAVTKAAPAGKDGVDTGDIEALAEIMETNDILLDEMPKFVAFLLPKMIGEADNEAEVDCDEFLEYCRDNEVDDEFNTAMFEFAMLGFTDGRSEKKPKVKMSLK